MRRKTSKGSPNQRLHDARVQYHWSQKEVADRIGTTPNNVSRWELGQTRPRPYFCAKLRDLFGKRAHELGLSKVSPLPPPIPETELVTAVSTSSSEASTLALWTVPYARNRYFTGRAELLEQLDHLFSLKGSDDLSTTTRRVALTQVQAIKGLGGIGKTQIAVEYAYRARKSGRYTHILWVDAANEESIMASFAALAELIPAFLVKSEMDQRKIVTMLKRWLEQCQQHWLLIFDNVEDIPLIQQYCPGGDNGSLLFTTRMRATGSLASSMEVENMGLVEGTDFLLHRAQRYNASDEEFNEATNVVMALDGFPLALDQAGAYIEETGCDFRDYLKLYQEHRHILLARRGAQATHYPDSVATTWSLSFQKVEQANPAATELLRLIFPRFGRVPELRRR